jgi:hypothetical protein
MLFYLFLLQNVLFIQIEEVSPYQIGVILGNLSAELELYHLATIHFRVRTCIKIPVELLILQSAVDVHSTHFFILGKVVQSAKLLHFSL